MAQASSSAQSGNNPITFGANGDIEGASSQTLIILVAVFFGGLIFVGVIVAVIWKLMHRK